MYTLKNKYRPHIVSITFMVLAHWPWNFHMHFFTFSLYSSSFLLKMLAADAKKAENQTQSDFFCFMMDESFGGSVRTKVVEAVCKRDWHNVRLFIFLTSKIFGWEFQTPCARTFIHCLRNFLSSLKKKNWIGLNFLCFYIRNKHFERKGWRKEKKKRKLKFQTRCAKTFNVLLNFASQVNVSWFKIFVLENKANTG